MKISVITLHRVRNYGSSLQTLATQKLFEKHGIQVEIVDYYPERYTSLGLLKRLKYKSQKLENNFVFLMGARFLMSFSYLKKKIIFDSFLKKYIKVSSKTYHTDKELKQYPLESDAYCTGSDQVWNTLWNEGIDTPFYLSFVPEDKYKFSYAASIGMDSLKEDDKSKIKSMLLQYNNISVRESQGVNILQNMGISCVQLIDPTLYFTAEFWNNYASDIYNGKKYVLTYNLHHDNRIDELSHNIAKKIGCKVYNISYNVHDIIRNGYLKWCPTVNDFLGLIKNAAYVITDSFHAVAFSIIFHTNFFALYPVEASSRLRSILKMAGLENRGNDLTPEIDTILENIDFSSADSMLAQQKKKSDSYIKKIISELK